MPFLNEITQPESYCCSGLLLLGIIVARDYRQSHSTNPHFSKRSFSRRPQAYFSPTENAFG